MEENVKHAYDSLKGAASDFNYQVITSSPAVVLLIFKKNKINSKESVRELLENLDLIVYHRAEEENFTIANWVCNNAKGPGTIQQILRAYLKAIICVNSNSNDDFITNYFVVTNKDIADYGAGLVGGVLASFSIDILKGIVDSWKMQIQMGIAIHNQAEETLISLLESVQSETKEMLDKFSKDFEKLKTKSNLVIEKAKTMLPLDLTPPDFGLNPNNNFPAESFVEDLIKIFAEILDKPTQLNRLLLDKLKKVIEDFWNKYKDLDPVKELTQSLEKLVNFIQNYWPNIIQRQNKLILDGNFFEAGYVTGNEIGNIAQMIEAVLKILMQSYKLAILLGKKIPSTQKAIIVSFIMSISTSETKAAVENMGNISSLNAPGISLLLSSENNAEIVSKVVSNEVAYAKATAIEVTNLRAAKPLLTNKEVPLLSGCSAAGLDSSNIEIIIVLGVLTKRRVFLSKSAKGQSMKQILRKITDFYTFSYARNYVIKIFEGADPYLNSFYDLLKEDLKIPINKKIELKQLLTKWTEFKRKEFESILQKNNLRYISPSGKTYKVGKRSVFNHFNNFISNEIRIKLQKNENTLVTLVDEKFKTLLGKVINTEAVCMGNPNVKVKDLLDMSIKDFLVKYHPDKPYAKAYNTLLIKLEKNGCKKLVQRSNELHIFLENPQIDDELRNLYLEELESISEEINNVIDKKKIALDEEEIFINSLLGKMNINGKIGTKRPDVLLMDLFENTHLIDFIHVSSGNQASKLHLASTEVYQLIGQMIFGITPKDNQIVMDIIYQFSEGFFKKLP